MVNSHIVLQGRIFLSVSHIYSYNLGIIMLPLFVISVTATSEVMTRSALNATGKFFQWRIGLAGATQGINRGFWKSTQARERDEVSSALLGLHGGQEGLEKDLKSPEQRLCNRL